MKPTKQKPKFKAAYYLKAYECARAGQTDRQIAKSLGISFPAFIAWKRDRPSFKQALDKGNAEFVRSDPVDLIKQLTNPRQVAFLSAYIHEGTIWHAARVAKTSRQVHWQWLDKDPDYVTAWEYAQQAHRDTLVRETIARGRDGKRQYKFHKGQPIPIPCEQTHPEAMKYERDDGTFFYARPYYELRYSDTLLVKLLEAYVPEFKPASNQTNVNVGNSVVLQDLLEEVEASRGKIIDASYVQRAAEAYIEANQE